MSLTGSIIGWLKCVESTHYESVDFSAYTFQSLYTGFEWLLFRIDALYFRDISPVLDTSSRGQNGIDPTQPKDLLNWQTKERQRDCHYSNPFQYCAISTAAGFFSRNDLRCWLTGIIYSLQMGWKIPFKTTSSLLSPLNVVIMTIVEITIVRGVSVIECPAGIVFRFMAHFWIVRPVILKQVVSILMLGNSARFRG